MKSFAAFALLYHLQLLPNWLQASAAEKPFASCHCLLQLRDSVLAAFRRLSVRESGTNALRRAASQKRASGARGEEKEIEISLVKSDHQPARWRE